MKMGKLDRQEIVSTSFPPEERCLPLQGSGLLAIFCFSPPKPEIPILESEMGTPKYLIGQLPNLQLSILASFSCSDKLISH